MKKAIYPDDKTNTMKPFTNVFNLFLMSDCGTPSGTGYTYKLFQDVLFKVQIDFVCQATYLFFFFFFFFWHELRCYFLSIH